MIIAITGHHVFQSIWALTNAHFTSKVCFFSNVTVKVLWVPPFLTAMIFFYFFHSIKIFIVNFAVRLFIDSRVSSSGGSSPPPPPKGREKEEKRERIERERKRER